MLTVFYLAHFVGRYTECKKMHGMNNKIHLWTLANILQYNKMAERNLIAQV